jgi:hypothetical protein
MTTRAATIHLDAAGIIHVAALPKVETTLDDARHVVAALVTVAAGTPRPLLADMREVQPLSRDVRTYYLESEAIDITAATAILVGSPMSRMIGNLFLRFTKSDIPTRLFTSEADARDWLHGFLG